MGLSLAFLTSCAADLGSPQEEADRGRWLGDQAFTAKEQGEIELGAAWIASKVGVEAPDIVWGAPHAHSWEEAPSWTIVRRPGLGGHYAGPGGGMNLAVDVIPYGSSLASYAAHEFGHAYGLAHTSDASGGIMRPYNPTLRWTDEERHACAIAAFERCAEPDRDVRSTAVTESVDR